jgi:DNA-binding transcriptional MerR regulator
MKTDRTELWTIHQLSAEVERALAVDYVGSRNGRVRDIPDLRTIRYYTTAGLLERPAVMRGRTALYGRRHLLQLVAIKKLQARGLSLSQVQERLAGATDAMLRRLASGQAHADSEMDADSAVSPGTGQNVAAVPFWKSRPVPVPTRPKTREKPGERAAAEPERSSTVPSYEEMTPLQAIGLADQVMLLVDPSRPVGRQELLAIRKAAAPLIRHLRKQKLIQPLLKGEGDDKAASPTD